MSESTKTPPSAPEDAPTEQPEAARTRDTENYQREYIRRFVEKWDDLIDWDRRSGSEGDFFIRELASRGAKRILDVATGTGFHSIRLTEAGFEVVSADGNPNMLARAFRNGEEQGLILRCVQADWRWLNRDVHGPFDAVICLGNSFTHLHTEHDRRKALAECYALLRHDGVLILDHRNYDAMLDEGFSSKHRYYYCGEGITAEPEYLDPGLARFRYDFPDGESFHLNMYPLRRRYVKRLMREVGFQRIFTYGDFQEDSEERPDFYIHVAEKAYRTPSELSNEEDPDQAAGAVAVSRDYYDSTPADRFYATLWGGEDIHVGIYEDASSTIGEASRRTVERMIEVLPPITEDTAVIDLGAGYGGAARLLAERFGCRVSCLNLSEVQNRRNRRLNREQELGRRIEVLEGNFEQIPHPDERFDVVWSQDSFLHSGNRDRVIAEAARVLKPGGHLVFTDPMQREDSDPDELRPVLERIHLDSMGDLPFYREAASRHGLQERQIVDLTPHLVTHYARVREELEGRDQELRELCGEEYVTRMHAGLGHWVDAGRAGNLRWGILLFRKEE